LGIKLDYNKLPAGTDPPGFRGQSDRYDSNGNSCSNITGLMDDEYLNDVHKFTTCSREDYKAYYNQVLGTYGTFCLDCKNDAGVHTKCEQILDTEITPTRNNLITKLPVLHKDFEMRFQLKTAINSRGYSTYNVLHLTTNGDNSKYGDRIPSVYVARHSYSGSYDTHNKMTIRFHANGVTNEERQIVVPQNVWIDVRLSQKEIVNEHILEYQVGNKTVTMTNSVPAEFKRVLVYVSDNYVSCPSSYYGTIQIKNFEVCTTG